VGTRLPPTGNVDRDLVASRGDDGIIDAAQRACRRGPGGFVEAKRDG